MIRYQKKAKITRQSRGIEYCCSRAYVSFCHPVNVGEKNSMRLLQRQRRVDIVVCDGNLGSQFIQTNRSKNCTVIFDARSKYSSIFVRKRPNYRKSTRAHTKVYLIIAEQSWWQLEGNLKYEKDRKVHAQYLWSKLSLYHMWSLSVHNIITLQCILLFLFCLHQCVFELNQCLWLTV